MRSCKLFTTDRRSRRHVALAQPVLHGIVPALNQFVTPVGRQFLHARGEEGELAKRSAVDGFRSSRDQERVLWIGAHELANLAQHFVPCGRGDFIHAVEHDERASFFEHVVNPVHGGIRKFLRHLERELLGRG